MAKRGNGEGTIYYSEPKKRWVAQYTINGKRKTIYGKTMKEANDKKLKALSSILNGSYIDKNNIRFVQLLKDLEDMKLSANLIKEASYARNMNTISKIENYFHDIKLQDITSNELQIFLNKQIELSQSTIDKLWQTMNAGFKKAINEDLLLKNPLDKVLKPISIKFKKQVVAFNIEEQKKLLSYLKLNKEDSSFTNMILLSLFTGMRVGEICALTYNDIDFKNKVIIVTKTLTKDKNYKVIMGKNTKTGRKKKDGIGKREIPFEICEDDFLETLLREQINLSKTILNNKNNLLFCKLNGKYIVPSETNNVFKRICKNANIKVINTTRKKSNGSIVNLKSSDVNFHMCRHTFATRFIESGGDAVVLSKLLGHSKIETTLDIYVDVFDKFRDKKLKDLNNYYKINKLSYKIS